MSHHMDFEVKRLSTPGILEKTLHLDLIEAFFIARTLVTRTDTGKPEMCLGFRSIYFLTIDFAELIRKTTSKCTNLK